jgi:hypothetical protein
MHACLITKLRFCSLAISLPIKAKLARAANKSALILFKIVLDICNDFAANVDLHYSNYPKLLPDFIFYQFGA